jgi:hypothetical protein
VCHVIRPNPRFNPNRPDSKFKRYQSCYYEKGYSQQSGHSGYLDPAQGMFLRESGYDLFPALAPRWEVTGEDSYATSCPGMSALPDIKQLQIGERKIAAAIAKMVDPPMQGPPELRNTRSSLLPGDITYVVGRDAGSGLRPIHEVEPKVRELEEKQQQIRQRISRVFKEDLFLMLAQSDRRNITAREIEERHEEKLMAIGPTLEQLNQDLLDPLIDITFAFMDRQGMLPPPPEEVWGRDLKVEYVSVMAQAQKLIGVAGVERFAGFVGQLFQASQDPTVWDKVDKDRMVEEYATMTGAPAGTIRSDEEAAMIRQARAEEQRQAQAAEGMRELAGGAKDLAGANLEGDNALTRLLKVAEAGQVQPTA